RVVSRRTRLVSRGRARGKTNESRVCTEESRGAGRTCRGAGAAPGTTTELAKGLDGCAPDGAALERLPLSGGRGWPKPVVSGAKEIAHVCVGSVPGMKYSVASTPPHPCVQSVFVVMSMDCVTSPDGRGQSGGAGFRLSTWFMNAAHAGPASTPPLALALI